MPFLHNIRTVAQYEAKTLRRSWFFRLFSIGSIVIFTFMNIGIYSPVGDEEWQLVSISSSLPLLNLYLLNIGQAIVVIFLAADFLKRDKKLDTNEVLYTRSMSNFEYVIGKTWGILRLFLGLDLLILAIALIINITSKSMSIDYMAYISYLLIICVPTIVFSLGLAFVMMSVIRNQPITFLLLLGIAALNIFYLWFRLGSIFDYMAFGIPVFKSSLIGFDNLYLIVNQRLFYFALGMALVLITVLLFRRLPQSHSHTVITVIFLFIFLVISGICGYNTWSVYSENARDKSLILETGRKFEDMPFPSITDESIKISHAGKTIEATADIRFINENNEPVQKYLFSLNPSLNVQKISSAGKELKFIRTNQIIEIDQEKFLQKGQYDSLSITYNGRIDESYCYPEFSDNIKENPYRIAMLNVSKRQAILTDNYVLLTPESNWYPSASLNYYPSNPARIKVDFTKFTLTVRNEEGLTSVSQGKKKMSDGHSIFKPESPLTGLTLAIGAYRYDSIRIDSVDYINYYFPGHDYYKKDLSELKDTLSNLVSGIMRDLETNFSVKYPFKTLSLVEVPVQFYSYPKESTQTRAEVQPSMVLLPEKLSTLQNAGFHRQFTRQKRRMARDNQVITDKELQVRIFSNFIKNTFISGQDFTFRNGTVMNEPTRYRLGPSFYFFRNSFSSSEYPVINAVFESHLQKMEQIGSNQENFGDWLGVLSENDKANLILKKISFRDLLSKTPGGDTIRIVLTVKGDWFFNLLRCKAGPDAFRSWFLSYMDRQAFKRVDIQQFDKDFQEKFGVRFYPYLKDWYNAKDQPGFLITDLKATEIIVGERSRYQVMFNVSNPEPVAGLLNISFRLGEGGNILAAKKAAFDRAMVSAGGGSKFEVSLRGIDASDISKIVFMEPREARKVGIVLDAQPRDMNVNTLFSQNIPGEISIPVNEIIKAKIGTKEFSDEEILSSMPLISDPHEIIVDNEDPGFSSSKINVESPLKKLFRIGKRRGDSYMLISEWNTPEYWQPVVQTTYYGKYVRSAVYTRAGTGDKSVTWATAIKDPGYYDVYSYIGKIAKRATVNSGDNSGDNEYRESEDKNKYKDMHYKILHDNEVEEITLDYASADPGWNNLGRYYISSDSAKVILTNKSSGRLVIGDAIKWVKQK